MLLAIAAVASSLVLLSATVAAGAADQGGSATAAVGGDECVDFRNEGGDVGADGDTGTDAGAPGAAGGAGGAGESAPTGASDEDAADGDGIGDGADTSQDNAATDEGADTAGDSSGTDNATDTTDDNSATGADGEDPAASQDGGGGSGDTASAQDEGASEGECVVADTVPDESLLPTGAPEKSRTGEKTAEEKSDGDREQGSRERTTQEEKSASLEAQNKTGRTEKQRDTASVETRKKTAGGDAREKAGGSEVQGKSDRGQAQSKSGSGDARGKVSDGGAQKEAGSDDTVAFRGQKVEVDDRAGKGPRQEELEDGAEDAAATSSDPAPQLAATRWTRPSRGEILSTKKPRRFDPDPGAEMTLSARALGLYDMPVANTAGQEDLDDGLVRVPETSRPWDQGGQKNVFIAGHYLGTPGTGSRLAFYNLHDLERGDELVLKDGRGRAYKYRVSEKFAVGPEDSWAMGQVRDRDMLTLQTCIPPDFGKRLMVRADRVRD